MSGKDIEIPGVGPATMFKRRGMRNIRISVSPAGKVRINIPKWAPYIAAERFAFKNRDWIQKQIAERNVTLVKDGDVIGHGAVVRIEKITGNRTLTKVTERSIIIRSPLDPASQQFQAKAKAACEKSLKLQAEAYLPNRVAFLAKHHGFKYGRLSVKRLTSRWGSCSPQRNISLSLFLIQLPDELVDYVLLHELAHTEQMNHGPKFWARLEKALPDARQIRKRMRGYRPYLSGKGKFDNIDNADLPLR